MARCIDVEKLIEYIDKNVVCTSDDSEECKQFMLEHLAMEWFAPTVDAVKVVRCKDCTQCYHNPSLNTFRCGRFMTIVKPTDFCSYGGRKSK